MNFFDRIADFLLSNERRFSAKFLLFAVVASGLLFIDYFFRFSDSYITNIKIKQIEQIESILQKDSLRTEARNELIRIERSAIQRQGFWELLPSFDSLISLIQSTINSPNANTTTNTNTSPIVEERDVWWHNVTSGWIFWLIIAFSPFALFGNKVQASSVVAILLVDFFLAALAFVFAYLFAFIPVLIVPAANYIVNAVLCLTIFVGVIALGSKINGKK